MMQDPISSFHSIDDSNLLQQQQQQIKCPRCESTNTKFCYYNNYNLSQPRHFCKNCRRYWTKGGTLRNIPVGGGSRKNSKRPSSSDSSSSNTSSHTSNPKRARDPKPEHVSASAAAAAAFPNPTAENATAGDTMLEMSGTFSSLLQSNGQFGNLLDGFGSDPNPDHVAGLNPQQQQGEGLLGWVGGWPDLAIYTSPGSSFM